MTKVIKYKDFIVFFAVQNDKIDFFRTIVSRLNVANKKSIID